MDSGDIRENIINEITSRLNKISQLVNSRLYLNDSSNEDDNLLISTMIDNIKYIQENVSYVPNTLLSIYRSNINDVYDELESTKSNTLDKASYLINRIKSGIIVLKESVENARLLNKKSYERGFDIKVNELSNRFNETMKRKINGKRWFLFFAILFTIILGMIYIYFFYLQYTKSAINYMNHLMLVAACFPVIFLVVWLYYQVGHYTRLSDLYTYKSNLAYTLKIVVDYVLSVEKDGLDKKVTLEILKKLLYKLYESPMKVHESNDAIAKNISELTNLVKELKGLVGNPSSSK